VSDSAQLLIATAGAVAGFAIAGPTGAQIGWAAGSLVGSSFGPKQQGPRLADLKVQISSYGAPIPDVYGGVRTAGNVIWALPLDERTSSSGGKGGPEVETYSYFQTFAVLIDSRIIPGIRKIWFNSKLVYDISEGADAQTQAASARFADYFTWYTGSETQLPDPTIEAAEGVGNVEAYRGCAYIVFDGVPVESQVTNVEVETVTDTPDELETEDIQPLMVWPWEETPLGPRHSNGGEMVFVALDTDGTVISSHDTFEAAYAAMIALNGGIHTFYQGYWTSASEDGHSVLSAFNAPGGAQDELLADLGPRYVYLAFNVEMPTRIEYRGGPETGLFLCSSLLSEGATPDADEVWMLSDTIASDFKWGHAGLLRIQYNGGAPIVDPPGYGDHINNNCTNYPVSGGFFPTASLAEPMRIRVERIPTLQAVSCVPGDPDVLGIAELPGNPLFCLSENGEISPNYEYTETAGTFRQLLVLEQGVDTIADSSVTQYPLGPVLRSTDPNYNNSAWWDAQAAAAGISGTYGVDYGIVVSTAAVGESSAQSVADGGILLSEIVSDICEQCGLESSQIDVSDLTDVVQGYIRPRVMTGRAAIEPLRQAYFFDAVENGDEIVFVKRGGASVVTIPADELGASEGGEPEPLVTPKRAQETELPATVRVTYMVREADYQVGSQQARRVTTGSRQIVDVELPIVMTDEKGAEVADVLLHDGWVGRTERKFSTTRKYTKHLPTDVVTVNDGEFTYTGQLLEKMEDGPVIRWTLRDTIAAIYSPNVTPSQTSGGGGEIRFDGPMRLMLMDLPALRDDDYDSPGFYAVAGSYGSQFRGGAIYKSADDTAYSSIQAMNVAGVMGYATTVLGDFSGGNTVDEVNSVTVTLYDSDATLSSITRAELLNDGGACLLGNEVLQIQRRTLIAPKTYKLTGFLRGRKGTEQHMASHAINERFVVLDPANVYRVSQQLAEVGEAYYKGVANGTAIVDAATQEFENTAAALKPWTPVHLYRAFTASGYAVQWVRRPRFGGVWSNGTDVPLGEATEQYRVRVLDGTTVLETQTVTEPYAEVGNHPGMTVEVCQLSALVGAGFPATVTL
jgi:hypothetical protein